jgi:hypothetical protein
MKEGKVGRERKKKQLKNKSNREERENQSGYNGFQERSVEGFEVVGVLYGKTLRGRENLGRKNDCCCCWESLENKQKAKWGIVVDWVYLDPLKVPIKNRGYCP